MRIIAGRLKGRRLEGPGPGRGDLRPTSDMARGALFSVLARWPMGPFLDVFSGTGAVALEAVSRGYSPVWCIEGDVDAVARIRGNMGDAPLSILHMDALAVAEGGFSGLSAVFADPPYDKSLEMWSALAGRLGGFLSPGGVLAWECPKGLTLPPIQGLGCVLGKKYGAASILFFERKTVR